MTTDPPHFLPESGITHSEDGATPAQVDTAGAESKLEDSDVTPPDKLDRPLGQNTQTSSEAQVAVSAEPAAAPRSPAEAFADLADGVGRLQREVGMIADYVRGTGASLRRSADNWRFEGAEAAVGGLIRIHDLLYRQTRGLRETKRTIATIRLARILLDAVEGELASVDVVVIEPREDDPVDLKLMVTIGNEPVPLLTLWKRGVANVVSCAYVYRSSLGDRILKKSEVVVWRGRRDIALDVTDGEINEEAASRRDRSGDDLFRSRGPEPRGSAGDRPEQ